MCMCVCVFVCHMVSMKLSSRCVCVLGIAMSDEEDEQMRRDALSMSIVGTKGLLNPSGENNCFLNSAVQVRDSTLTDCL